MLAATNTDNSSHKPRNNSKNADSQSTYCTKTRETTNPTATYTYPTRRSHTSKPNTAHYPGLSKS